MIICKESLKFTKKEIFKLTLNKKAYRKGDVIKGRIDCEYLEEMGKHVALIKVFGVFKAILK